MKKSNNKSPYTENLEINSKLIFGDKAFIASKTGYSRNYVSDVMKGRRNNNKIIELAKAIVEKRNEL